MGSTRKRIVRAAGLVSALMLIASPAAAADTLDQSQDLVGNFTRVNSDGWAMTYTAGADGQLSRVSLWLGQNNDPASGDLSVQIRTVNEDGTPGSTTLATATVPKASIPQPSNWVDVALDVPQVGGTSYAIHVTAPATSPDCGTAACGYLWGIQADGYALGDLYLSDNGGPWTTFSNFDATFRTWLTVSEAPTIADLVADVQALGLGNQEGSVVMWLERAQADLDAGDVAGACSDLDKFAHKVQTWSGKHIDAAAADALLADTAELRTELGC